MFPCIFKYVWCTCMCVHMVCVGIGAHAGVSATTHLCVLMWRPEVDMGCLHHFDDVYCGRVFA